MSEPDLEIVLDPGTVWRVGFAPDPWAWTPWIFATDAGLFDGRWDDQQGEFRTLYTSASLLGCFLELLAKPRPDSAVQEALDQIDDPDNLAADDHEAPTGMVGYYWLRHLEASHRSQFGGWHVGCDDGERRAGVGRQQALAAGDPQQVRVPAVAIGRQLGCGRIRLPDDALEPGGASHHHDQGRDRCDGGRGVRGVGVAVRPIASTWAGRPLIAVSTPASSGGSNSVRPTGGAYGTAPTWVETRRSTPWQIAGP